LPDQQELKDTLARVGFGKIKLDPQKRTVQLLVAGMLLDLGGIAKGFAADAVLAVLRRFGIRQALVAAGGDIVAGEAPPGARGWKVGIAPLKNPEAKPQHYLLLVNKAVSTSGDVEQYVQIGGKRYSHIVDPKTGLGVVGRSSVTVIAPNGTTSDALATAVSVMGPQRSLALIEKTAGTACLIMRENEKGELQMHRSKGFEKYRYPEKE
jgi:thiamine biosynthesis lipoprotein